MRVRELIDLLRELDARQTVIVGTADGQCLAAPHAALVSPEAGLRRSAIMLYSYPPEVAEMADECDCLLCRARVGAALC